MSYNNNFLRKSISVPSLNSNESYLTDTYLFDECNSVTLSVSLAGTYLRTPTKNGGSTHTPGVTPAPRLQGVLARTVQPRVCCLALSGPSVPRVTFNRNPVTVVTNLLSNCRLKLHPHQIL